jgi:ferritin-like metal-binding protein YciE
MTTQSKITQYLQDAQALEGALRRSLIAHIAVSARDEHRALLQEHLQVTIAQEKRIAQRLKDRGVAANPAQAAFGAAKGAAALALTLAKGPADALRGPTGDDVTLRNAQDECASEALEIAVYDTLEILAVEGGDGATAELARRHRDEEQAFLTRLQDTLPGLARNVSQNARGNRRFPLSTIGAIDGVRALAIGLQTVLRSEEQPSSGAAPAATPKPRPARPAPRTEATPPPRATTPRKAAPPAKPKAKAKAKTAPVPAPKRKPTPAAPTAARPVKPEAARQAPAAELPKQAASAPRADQPLAEYDEMTPYEITELLDHLPEAKLDEVERYEREHNDREQILTAIERQRAAAGA